MRAELIERYAEDEERERMEYGTEEEGTTEIPQTGTTEGNDPLLGDYDANEPLPFQKVGGEQGALTKEETALRDALVERAGLPQRTVMDAEKGQYVLDAANGNVRTQKMKDNLQKAEIFIAESLAGKHSGQRLQIELPNATRRLIRRIMGRDYDSHNIYANGIVHGKNEHGINGKKSEENSIPLRDEDFGLAPYIMTAPDKVEKGSSDITGRESIRFIKTLSNGYVVVVEKEQKSSPNDMDTITMWAEMSSRGADARSGERPLHTTSETVIPSFDAAKIRKDAETAIDNELKNPKTHKVSEKSEEETQVIFDTAKKKFGVTSDLREAGYILPDGTMLDFSGRHELFGADDSGIRGRRTTDHRGISSIAYAYDAEGNDYDTGVETSMPDFIERGAIRIDANVGTINLSSKPTAAQRRVLQRLVQRSGGDVIIDYGNGWDSQHYSEYEGAKTSRVLSDIDRYFDEGIRTEGNIRYFRTSNGEAYGFTLNGKIYIDPRIAKADTPIHEYTHLWAEGMRESDPEGWRKVVDIMRGEKELWDDIKARYPELRTDDEIADEVLAHYSGTRGAERLREEMRKIAESDSTMDEKTRAISALENVRRALNTFWKKVAERLGIKFTTAEEVADMVLRDMLNSVDPLENAVGERMAEHGVRRQDVRRGDVFYSNAQRVVEGISQKKVKLAISGQDYNVEVLGEENGMVKLRDLESGEEYDLSRERFDAFAKAADDKAAAAQAEAAAQAQREENRKAGITGYAEGNPDLSHPDNDMRLVTDYLKEQEPAQQDRVKTQAATHIGTLNDNIESMEADVARRREWYENAKDMSTPENLSARKEALDKAEAELAEAKARRDNWERVRVALMSDKELNAMKEERKASRQQWEAEEQEAQKDSKPVLSGEKAPLDKDAVLEKYETRGEAYQAMLSEFRRHDRRVGDIDNRIRYIDKQLDAWRDGEPMTEQEVRALIAEREALRKEDSMLRERMAALGKTAKKQLAGWYKEREQANMSESELNYARLDKETDYNRKMKLAKEAVMADKDIDGNDRDLLLMVLDRVEPETVEEFVAENLPYGSINWEGLIGDGGRKIRGLKDELGGRRGIGHGYDTNSYNAYLAKKGEGMSPDQVAHEMWEASPEDGDGNKRWSDMEIKHAMLDLLQGAEKPTDISHRLPNDRIEEVLQMRDEMIERRAEEEAAMEAQQPETAEAEPQPTGEFRDPVTGEIIDPNEKVPFQKVEGEKGTLTEEEVAARDVFVDAAKKIFGDDVVTDWEVGQKMLDADAEMQAKFSFENLKNFILNTFHSVVGGNINGPRIPIGRLTEEGRKYLEVVSGLKIKENVEFNLNVSDLLHIYNDHYGSNEKDIGNNIPLTDEDIKNLAEVIAHPDHIVYGIRKDNGKKMFFFLKDNSNGTYNLAEVYSSKYGKLTAKTYYKTRRVTSQRVNDLKKSDTLTSVTDGASPLLGAKIPKLFETAIGNELKKPKSHKVSDTPEEKEKTGLIFDTAKKKFGVTSDIREAGYILPDGTMLDFSGRHELFGADDSGIRGRRTTDHRGISSIAYAYDAEGNEYDTGVETSMPDFIERGAIRIDANAGTINLSVKPTAQQRAVLRRLIQRCGGDVIIDYGNGWDSQHYSEYEGAKTSRVLSDIDRYFDEGIRTEGNIRYFRTSNGEAYGFTLNGKIYIDPRIAKADTPIHEYTHLWAEGMRQSDPEGWKRVVDLMRSEKELWEKVKKDYPELKTDDELADEVLAHYSGTRGAERLREEMRKIAEGDGTLDAKTRAIAALENVRRALNDFWRSVANKLGIKFTTAEEVADMVLRDMLNGVDPREKGSEGGAHRQEVLKGDIFVSNARKAVEGIKQDKATGDQWLAMIQKQGGLKAAEDKWMGLSDWLNERKGKSVTKEEVMNFIRENQVQIEEVNYQENAPKGSTLESRLFQLANNTTKEAIQLSREKGIPLAEASKELMDGRYGKGWDEYMELDYLGMLRIDNYASENEAAKFFGVDFDKDAVRESDSTRLEYTTKGLSNKKEIALTVPTIEPWEDFDKVHFGDAGEGRAVAWIRFGETTDADGNNVLVIDEIQSKRHQEGRERGYRSQEEKEWRNRYKEIEQEQRGLFPNDILTETDRIRYMYSNEGEGIRSRYYELEEERRNLLKKIDASTLSVPDAPFEKNWHELAMKRMLRYAAENGYDKIAWTKGDQQAERYNLAAVVNNIAYVELPNGEIDARAYFKDGGYEFLGSTWKEVEESVGKDMARRMQQGESTRTDTKEWGRDKDYEPIFYDYKVIEGDGLRIGGEGMKGFYDEILPRFMKKYGKKWGATVGEVELPGVEEAGRKMWSVDVTPEMRVSVLQGQPMFQKVVKPTPFILSDNKDAEGNKMYERNGSIDLWDATPLLTKARRQNAPIRLSERNMKHIISRHSDRLDSEEKVFEFLDNVFANATKLRRARGRGIFVVVENENTDSIALIKLMPSEDSDYYNIDTAGYYRKNKWNKSEEVIADLSEPNQSDAVADASKPQVPDINGEGLINTGAQLTSSKSKDRKSSSNFQANGEENLQESDNGVEFVGESRSTSRPVPQYIKKYFGSTTGDEFSNQEKDTILEGYNHIKAQNPHAIAMIKTPKGYVLINEDRRMLAKDLGTTFAPFVLIKPNDVDLVRTAVVGDGKMIGIVDINDNAWRKAAVRPMPQPKTSAAPEGKPLSNTGTAQTEKDPGVYGWADRRRTVYGNEEPVFTSVSDAAWWCYDLIGNVRSANEKGEYSGKDYSRLLSMDDSHGEQVDVEKAKKHAGMVIPMAEMMKKHLIIARDRSKSEAAARYVQGLIDECDNAIDWYQRAAKGDRTIFDDERPRMFRVSRDGKGLDKKTVDGTWTESEVRVMEQKLGGTKVTIDTEETIPETVRRRLLLGENIKGWYDESDGSVHLYAPAIESVEDARYTICHEKLGHEGLTALLGSQQAVTDWGNFMVLNASLSVPFTA